MVTTLSTRTSVLGVTNPSKGAFKHGGSCAGVAATSLSGPLLSRWDHSQLLIVTWAMGLTSSLPSLAKQRLGWQLGFNCESLNETYFINSHSLIYVYVQAEQTAFGIKGIMYAAVPAAVVLRCHGFRFVCNWLQV